MRQFKSVYIVVLMIVLGLAVCSQAAEVKVGIIDFQQVVEKSEPGKRFEAELKKEGERIEAELTKDQEELKTLKEKIEREAMVMSREAREEKEIEFRVKARNYQEKEQDFRKMYMEKRNKEVNNLRKVVVEIAQEIGKKEGFTMVMSNAGVLYYDVSIDLTDKVVQLLNQRMAGK